MINTITEKKMLVHEKLFPNCADIDMCIKDYKKLELMTLDDMNKLKTKSRCGDNLMKHYFKHYLTEDLMKTVMHPKNYNRLWFIDEDDE